jgi:hypothetical protein
MRRDAATLNPSFAKQKTEKNFQHQVSIHYHYPPSVIRNPAIVTSIQNPGSSIQHRDLTFPSSQQFSPSPQQKSFPKRMHRRFFNT